MGAVLNLESFDDLAGASQAEQDEVVATYDDGVRDGKTAAQQANQREQAHIRASVGEALIDGMFGYREAQAHFTAGMTAYIDSILEQVLPQFLAPALHIRLRHLLVEALEKDAAQPILLRLPPDQILAFQAIVDDLDLSQVRVEPDATLNDHAAFFMGNGAETSIDFDALQQTIFAHSAVLIAPAKEVS
jgi:hypothetical protein